MCGNCEVFPSRALDGSTCTGPGGTGGEESQGRYFFTPFIALLLSQQAWAVKVPAEEWETVQSLKSLYEGHCETDALCEDVFPQLEVSSNEHPLCLL